MLVTEVTELLDDARARCDPAPLADMFFTPLELVARLSHDLTLEPGDVILCGTSIGVLPMKPGARVEVAIDGIGTLSNVYAPPPA